MKQIEYTPHTEPNFFADELLPCPFCGGEAELLFIGNGHTKSRRVEVKCKKCRIKRTVGAIRHGSEWCAKISINEWNQRDEKTTTTTNQKAD